MNQHLYSLLLLLCSSNNTASLWTCLLLLLLLRLLRLLLLLLLMLSMWLSISRWLSTCLLNLSFVPLPPRAHRRCSWCGVSCPVLHCSLLLCGVVVDMMECWWCSRACRKEVTGSPFLPLLLCWPCGALRFIRQLPSCTLLNSLLSTPFTLNKGMTGFFFYKSFGKQTLLAPCQ